MTNWIDIAEYANKYRVSQSTLRRRIRSQTIPFKMERGKYYIEDSQNSIGAAPLFSRHKIQQSAPAIQTATSPRALPDEQHFVSPSKVFDPVSDFLGNTSLGKPLLENNNSGLIAQLQQDLEHLQKENIKLQRLVAEQQTLIQALEAECGLPT